MQRIIAGAGLAAVMATGLAVAAIKTVPTAAPDAEQGTEVAPPELRPFDIGSRRAALRRLVWGSDRIPADWPNLTDDGRVTVRDDMPDAAVWTVALPAGMHSRIHAWLEPGRQKLAVYHGGHGAALEKPDVLARLWADDWNVVYVNMPLEGGNNRPTVQHPRFGTFPLLSHAHLLLADLGGYSLLRVFMQPIAEAVNRAIAECRCEHVAMLGFSGGGWATTLYAALDERIDVSVPIAGSLPMYLRSRPPFKSLGDAEQLDPGLLSIATYLDLYVMATDGGRRQLQILNRHDPCCFRGDGAKDYADMVRSAAAAAGGAWDLWIDEGQDEHAISDNAAQRAIEFAEEQPAAVR